jgi:predicted nucleic acid-binding protein
LSVFVDTSAFYAVFDADDEEHPRARGAWEGLVSGEDLLFTSNYVLVETLALLQSRLGVEAVRAFEDAVAPLVRVLWVDRGVHRESVTAVLTAGRRRLSLVDCSSFALMRRHGLDTAFAFDDHFPEQGFAAVP